SVCASVCAPVWWGVVLPLGDISQKKKWSSSPKTSSTHTAHIQQHSHTHTHTHTHTTTHTLSHTHTHTQQYTLSHTHICTLIYTNLKKLTHNIYSFNIHLNSFSNVFSLKANS